MAKKEIRMSRIAARQARLGREEQPEIKAPIVAQGGGIPKKKPSALSRKRSKEIEENISPWDMLYMAIQGDSWEEIRAKHNMPSVAATKRMVEELVRRVQNPTIVQYVQTMAHGRLEIFIADAMRIRKEALRVGMQLFAHSYPDKQKAAYFSGMLERVDAMENKIMEATEQQLQYAGGKLLSAATTDGEKEGGEFTFIYRAAEKMELALSTGFKMIPDEEIKLPEALQAILDKNKGRENGAQHGSSDNGTVRATLNGHKNGNNTSRP